MAPNLNQTVPGIAPSAASQADVAAKKAAAAAAAASAGYTENTFEQKPAQMAHVETLIREKGFLPPEHVHGETEWFYNSLGIDDMYFSLESVDNIANHIIALYGAKLQAYTKSDQDLEIRLEHETDDNAVYIHSSLPGVSQPAGPQIERRIDTKYLDPSFESNAYRLESYRPLGNAIEKMKSGVAESPSRASVHLRSYFVSKCEFQGDPEQIKASSDPKTFCIRSVSGRSFLEKATDNTIEIYRGVMRSVLERTGPVIELYGIDGSREKRLVLGYRQRSTSYIFSALSDLYHYYKLFSTRKYVEQFANGVTIISLYLNQMPNSSIPIDSSVHQVMKEASLIFCLPTTPLQSMFQVGLLSVQEAIYGHVVWIFCQHFLNRLGSEYTTLASLMDNSRNPAHADILNKIKRRLRTDTFTRDYILDIIKQYPDLVKALYVNFAMTHYVGRMDASSELRPTLSYQRLQVDEPLSTKEIASLIAKTVSNPHENLVFECILKFNSHVLKTNFYQPTKVALSFRMDPSFLPDSEYPTQPFALFLVIGSEFRGFHIRFSDIARGGIRIIRSRNPETYSINLRSLLDENYSLANTQQRKNKDIPEGGSKGTILLDNGLAQQKPKVAFEKYVDAMLDLLLVGKTPGIKERIVDLYKAPEILFFGPDEGTAEYMDWASEHARKRGAPFWKAFTTGKSQSLGGIPHDLYGMTTRSVHQYVLGILRKQNIKEEDCTKIQTGGPDGDLGSNEIKISKDRTTAVVDGSGVLHDPNGINREELTRLANKRLTVAHFDMSKLSKDGFRVLVDEATPGKLPNGSEVGNPLTFRNEFHLKQEYSATMFVPCGGRPEAVDISNVDKLLDAKTGAPRFKYIVEGANLFFTQEARLALERAGAVIFKDASANKGGVTSSSLEVLAALSFTDEEFAKHMCCFKEVPNFYKEYIDEVHAVIERNAAAEFECIWREADRTGRPRSVLSDEISYAILALNQELQNVVGLWENKALRTLVLKDALPVLLQQTLGLDTLMQRLPDTYQRALFGSFLASRFIYKHGVSPSRLAFFDFMAPYYARLNKSG